MVLLDGKKVSSEIFTELKAATDKHKASGNRAPHLCAILVGQDPASEAYVANKVKGCHEVGFDSTLFRLDPSVSERELLDKIHAVNSDDGIDGLIVQLPLPAHISVRKVTEAILPSKDVDGFHPVNTGRLMQNIAGYLPATPMGILTLMERFQVPTEGKRCVVLGRSNIVGMPVSLLLARNGSPGNCTVTICHSKTQNLEGITREADILVAALGRPHFIRKNMVKAGAAIIDVGITRVEAPGTKSGYRLAGDVHFDEVAPVAGWITPVPGGVGRMTIAGLLQNTLRAARKEYSY